MIEDVDWLVVQGSGAHIRSGVDRLLVGQGSTITEYALAGLSHLLLQGRHTIQTATVNRLVQQGIRVTFLEPDGEPVGVVVPYGNNEDERRRRLQETMPTHAVATTIVTYAAHARLGLIGEGGAEFYEGELELIQGLLGEMPNLVRLQELRRLHRMIGDMYYEIISRTIPPDLGFRRRTERPHRDPVNALLSLSYGILSGIVLNACIGARLDPSIGLLSAGERALVRDLADCFRTEMVDRAIFTRAREGIEPGTFDRTENRCRLSDEFVRETTARLRASIDSQRIDRQVQRYVAALESELPFLIV
ncbi:MAG: CRISPR-associated endonuclease Cas1 [Methanospirillum sp.]